MNIKVTTLKESPFSVTDIVELMHSSFKEHIEEGLCFTCSTMDADQFAAKTANSIVVVAWDEETDNLLGTATVTLNKDPKGIVYGYNEYLAVSPSAKRLGIGTKLLEKRIDIIIDDAGQYVMSDTAVGAKSSVSWHLKNGFKIIGLCSYASTNYYSYLFRKQIVPSKKWDSRLYCAIRFRISSMVVKAKYHKNGTLTSFGSLVKKVRR